MHILVRAIAIWAGAYKPKTAAKSEKLTLQDFRAMFPNGLTDG